MTDLIRVSLFGTLPGGEQWSVNPVVGLATGTVVSDEDLQAAVLAINAITIPAAVKNLITSSCTFSGVRLEARTKNGDLQHIAEGLRSSPVAGTGPGASPFQTSLVLSLRTPIPGARGRGRVYWPAVGVDPSGITLRLTSGDVSTYLTALKSYMTLIFNAITANVTEALTWVVWSRTNEALYPVTSMSIGDILDTQRRRRDAIPESYQTVSWP